MTTKVVKSTSNLAGIDWSITSPAICIHPMQEKWDWRRCQFYGFSHTDKQLNAVNHDAINLTPYRDVDMEGDLARFDSFASWATSLVQVHRVKRGGLEGYAMGAKGKVFSIAESTALMKYNLWRHNVDLDIYSPTLIKKFATESGRADKDAMLTAFVKDTGWNIKLDLHETDKQKNPSSDMVDSYWICKLLHDSIYAP